MSIHHACSSKFIERSIFVIFYLVHHYSKTILNYASDPFLSKSYLCDSYYLKFKVLTRTMFKDQLK